MRARCIRASPVVDADPEADRRLLEAIADWCDRYTPLVGLDPPDGLLLDVTGCAHLFGGEAALRRDLVARLARAGFAARAPRWPTRSAAPGRWRAMARAAACLVASETRDALLPLPLAALRIEPRPSPRWRRPASSASPIVDRPPARAARRALRQGLRAPPRSGARAATTSRSRRACRCRPAMAEQRFPEPIAREADVLGTIEHLARELGAACWSGAARARGCCRSRCSAPTARCIASRSAPARRCAIPRASAQLFVERLAVLGDECDPGFGYDMVRLSRAGDRALRSGADRPCRRRPCARSWRI